MTISAKIILDSVSPQGKRLVTAQWRYPKFIHGEAKTHRAIRMNDQWVDVMAEVGVMDDVNLSRNTSSSRAIPVERVIQDVLDDPVIPMHWGKNQPGMSADEEHSAPIRIDDIGDATVDARKAWLYGRNHAVELARRFAKAGYHKQIVNRLLEPFCHINVIVTATEWANFFALRDHPAAQPEIRELARQMKAAMAASTPQVLQPGEWHLPYVTEQDRCTNIRLNPDVAKSDFICDTRPLMELIKLSVARCASVSYKTVEGDPMTIEKASALYDRLLGANPLHASPAEHQAMPDKGGICVDASNGPARRKAVFQWNNPHLHGNLKGWIQYRKTLPNENIAESPSEEDDGIDWYALSNNLSTVFPDGTVSEGI